MPFELYAAKVRTERGEEAVNAWLETMKTKTRWRIKGDDDEAWIDDRAEAERVFGHAVFRQGFRGNPPGRCVRGHSRRKIYHPRCWSC